MIVEPESTNTNEIYCRRLRCRRFLGELVEGGQAIEIQNIRIWHEAVLTCCQCHKPYRFEPKPLAGMITLDELEKDYNF